MAGNVRLTVVARHGRKHEQAIAAHFDLILASVAAGRLELVRLHRSHKIDDEVLHNLEHDLDLEELGAIAAKNARPTLVPEHPPDFHRMRKDLARA